MTLVDKSQWSGWFGNLGSAGVVLQNAITAIMPFAIAALAIWMVIIMVKAGGAISGAPSPEARKEAKVKLGWAIVGLIIIIIAPTLVLIFMNTLGKTTQTTTSASSGTSPSKSLALSLNQLKDVSILKNNTLQDFKF